MRVGIIIEPMYIISGGEDQRHAIMDFGYHLICVGRNNREGSYPFTRSRMVPILPQSANAERIAVTHSDGVRFLGFALDGLPLEEAVNRHNAAASPIGISEHRQLADRFAFRVDRLAAALRVLTPIRDQPPAQRIERHLAGVVIAPDDQQFLTKLVVGVKATECG
jgi:hypothetical protein